MVDEWRARSDRPVTVPLVHVRPTEQVERLRAETTWRIHGRDAITLTKDRGQVLSGSVMFRAGAREERVTAGELVVLKAAIPHDVETLEESSCLLTLSLAATVREGAE